MNNNKRPTIATVAAQAGLSVATVDRVLNARAPVNESTAQRVFAAAESVGYFAARLIGQRIRERRPSYRFGILLLATAQTFYGNFAAAIRQAAQAHADANLSCQFEYIHDRSPAAIVAQLEQLAVQCDGLAVVSFAHPLINASLQQLRAAGVPIVALLSDIDEHGQEPYVGLDNHEVGRTMGWVVAHTCGAREGSVGVLVGGHRFLGHQQRIEGLRGYLGAHAPGLQLLEPLINMDNSDISEEATLELLARHRDLRGLCVVGGGGDGLISALRQVPAPSQVCCVVPESTTLSCQAMRDGLLRAVIDSPVVPLAQALVNLLLELQSNPAFDPQRQRVHVALQIITSENARD
jgi:LacI family transcriptional regulator